MRTLAEAHDREVLLADAGTEDRLRALAVDVARDLFGAEGCLAVLSLTRANLLRGLHEEQLRAGADLIRTNTIQASPLELRQFGLDDDAFAINYAAARIAATAVDAVPGGDRRRFVLGIVRDLFWDATPQEIEEATALQASAFIAGGADGVALEIATDACRGPAFLQGARRAKEEAKSVAGIFIFQNGGDAPESLRRLADGVIRYRELATVDEAGVTDALRDVANLIGGKRAEDTATLDQVLRAMAVETTRPPIDPTLGSLDVPSVPGFSPSLRRHPVQKSRGTSPSIAGDVIYCASRWAGRTSLPFAGARGLPRKGGGK
jgi:hypothetical protein